MKPTDVGTFIDELDAGVFSEKVAHALSEIAAGVVDHGKAGELQITLGVKPIGDMHQVTIDHKMKATRPTRRGKVVQEDLTHTPMHVGSGGRMSFFPENQIDAFDPKREEQKA